MFAKLKIFFKGFPPAFRGLLLASKERSFRFMFVMAVLALILSYLFPLENWEKIVIIFLIGVVFTAELINSQVERTLDIVQPDYDIRVKDVKDISAGAVLIASITSLIIGIIIFLPHLLWLKELLLTKYIF